MKKVNRSITALLLVFCVTFTNILVVNADTKMDNFVNIGDFLTTVVNALEYTKQSDKTFNDVTKDSAYKQTVAKAIEAGLLNYKENSYLKPEIYMSKSMAVSILTTAFRIDEVRVKSALEINSVVDERANFTKEFADKVIKELMGVKISGNSTEEKSIDYAYVTKKGVKISNLTVNTLIITPSVAEGDITIENSNIVNLVILKDGAKNVIVRNSNIEQAILAKENVCLTTEGRTTINKLTINAETTSLISKVSARIKEISLEYQPSIAIANGKIDKSKQSKLTAALNLEGEFPFIKVTDNINKLIIIPQKYNSDIKVSKVQINNTTNILQAWYKASIASVSLSGGAKLNGNVSVEVLNSSGTVVRKDTVKATGNIGSKLSELIKNAQSSNVDSEVFAGVDVSNKTVSYNTKLEDLELPQTVKFTSNQSNIVTGNIIWDYDKYDSKTAGKYKITGKVSGTNVSWTPETIDITVTVESMLTFTIAPIAMVIPKDTDETKLLEEILPQTATATLSNGKTITVKISDWECEGDFDPSPKISTNYVFRGVVSRLPASAGRRGQVTATVVVQLDPNYPFK